MTQTVFAVIYCALLASRSTGTCTSSRSATKIITDNMHNRHASKRSSHQHVPEMHVLRGCRHEARSKQSAPLHSKDPRKGGNKGVVLAVIARPKSLRGSRPPHPYNPRYLSQSAPLRLSNPRSLPLQDTHEVRANRSLSSIAATLPADHEVLRPSRESTAHALSSTGNITESWDAIERLQLSGTLPLLPDDEFLEFIPRAYKACFLSPDSRIPLSTESATRLSQLHDEILRRVGVSTGLEKKTFLVWVDLYAIQTLLLAGKTQLAAQKIAEALRSPRLSPSSAEPRVLLRQLFIASVLHESLEAGLSVLATFWPTISGDFHWFRPGQAIPQDAAELRHSVLFAFKAIEDSRGLIRMIEDKAAQTVGMSILAYRLCVSESTDNIHAAHRGLVANGLPMSLETHLQFLKSLLAGGAYARACDVRKRIRTLFGRASRPQIHAAVNLFPEITSPAGISDKLLFKAQTTAMERFTSCIKDPWMARSDVPSIWEDVETSRCHHLRRDDGQAKISNYHLRLFAKAAIENSSAKFVDSSIPKSKAYAKVLEQLYELFKQRYQALPGGVESKVAQTKLLPILCHSLILKGDLPSVRDMLLKEGNGHLADRARIINQLFLAYVRLHGLSEGFQSICALWPIIVRHVEDASGRWVAKEMTVQSQRLRDTLFQAFGGIEDPAAWIADNLVSAEAQEVAGHLFSHIFREHRDPDGALHLFNGLQARKLPISYHTHIALMKLFLPKLTDVAARVHSSLRYHFPLRTMLFELRGKEELHTGLRLFSRMGDTEQAEENFKVLLKRGLADRGARQRLMHAYAVNGNTTEVHRFFSDFYGEKSTETPMIGDFRIVIHAHVRAGDMTGINYWLEEMRKQGIQPDLGVYNMILTAFATSLELESAIAVLQRMRENKIQPDCISYTTVMSIMAKNRDPIGAEQLYQIAIEEGVIPDDIMVFTLMNTHVEAGSWKGAIRAYDYLQRTTRPTYLTGDIYDILLKAYVLIGAPFRTVYDLFRRYITLNMQPSRYAYALVIQSACDSGRMDMAVNLFNQLDTMDKEHGARNSNIDSYVMNILMAGFLRVGKRERARSVYEDMCARGIQPSAVTFGVIISSYANERSEESLRLADEFMQSLFAAEGEGAGEGVQRAWLGSAPGGRARALDAVYGPLLTTYSAQLDVSEVERRFDAMLAAGGQPGILNMTMLMDAYRRVGNLEGVKHVWGELLKMTQDTPTPPPLPAPSTRAVRGNMMCIALSVYINALSAASEHLTIARTWRDMNAQGFAFDAHNWNHLTVALVRAGEPERAFDIMENVILTTQRKALAFVRTRGPANTPLTYFGQEHQSDERQGDEDDPTRRDPRTTGRRIEEVRDAKRHKADLTPLRESDDPVQQLWELQQLAYMWSGDAWRPHFATLDMLGEALTRLREGLLVRPTGVALAPEDDVRRLDASEAAERRAEEQAEAARVVEHIYREYPGTVQLVEQRLGEMERVVQDETRSYS